jgi:beta-glucosidase
LQGNNNTYFKVIATAKHFAVHSGSEYNRHFFDAVVNKEDLFNTYLPAFESLVKDGKVYSIMGAYNRINGVPACANAFLLDTLLRKKWGFKGYVVSDCGAINDIYKYHKYTPTLSKAGAMAVQAGCDLTCGNEYINIEASVKDGFISEAVIDTSVKRLQLALLKLGMYDNDSLVQYQQIPYKENNSPQNNLLAKQAALESMVLLKNKNKLLPLSKNYKTIAVVGPYAADNNVLQGNYNGTPEQPVHFLNGIKNKVGNSINIITSNFIYKPEKTYANTQHLQDSIALTVQSVKDAELIIFCGGISAKVEGEESKLEIQGFFHGDRTDITLPDVQLKTLQALKQMGKPIVLVLTNGSALAINWENENIDAIVDAWYPGQQGGNALADILFGDANPCGKLPVTFYQSVKDLPEFEDYSMHNRTYKYFKGKVLYPFGFGLSYASFTCRLQSNSATQRKVTEKDIITIPVVLSNNSAIDGKETIQVYASGKNNPNFKPIKLLVAFNKVMVKAKEQKTVLLKIPVSKLRQYDLSLNDYKVYKGDYLFQIGNSSADTQCAITVHVQ